jgi:tetratricopeptide (TPR) repeat protein
MQPVQLLLIAILLSLAQDSLPAQADGARVPAELRLDAERAIAADRLPEAVTAIEKGLKIDPSWTDGLWKIGLLLYQSDQFEAALPHLARLTNLEPSNGGAWALLGMCEFQVGKYREAVEHIDRAEEIGVPDEYRFKDTADLDRGLAHIELGNFGTAAHFLGKLAPRKNPDERERLVLALGYAALRLSLAQPLSSEQQILLRAVGEAHYLNDCQNRPASDAAFAALFHKYPKTPMLHYAYGTVLLSELDYDAAKREFHAELAIAPDSFPANLGLAYVAVDSGNALDGLAYAKEAVRVRPDAYQPHLYYGRLLLDAGQAREATEELEASRRIAPELPEIRYVLAKSYRALGRVDQASSELAEFKRLKALREPAAAGRTPLGVPVVTVPKP